MSLDPQIADSFDGKAPSPDIRKADWILGGYPPDGSAGLYFGAVGAANWGSVTAEPTYPLNVMDPFSLYKLRRQAIKGRQFCTMVSFGPGDGLNDKELLAAMHSSRSNPNVRLRYVPIDISEQMLRQLTEVIDSTVDMPVAIQCDFERDVEFAKSMLTHCMIRPVLFSILGGTFANLDLGERQFLEWLRDFMSPGDAILIDIPTAETDWTPETEPRLKTDGYSPAFRKFLAFGIKMGRMHTGEDPDEPADAVFAGFQNQVRFQHTTNVNTKAEEIAVVDSSNGKTVLQFRRYRFGELATWIKSQGMRVTYLATSEHTVNRRFGMGVMLVEAD